MKSKRLTDVLTMILCTVMVIMIFPVTANADMGPKASVRILFENMGNELCYGTLLSKQRTTGPATVWDGTDENARHNGNKNHSNETFDYNIWKAFVEYKDADGYYFLQEGWKVSETKKIEWTYYPPNSFKILLYYPETETFVVSGIYEKYAFDTYYTVDMNGVNIGSVNYNEELSTDERIEAYRSYNYRVEIVSLISRILITIAIEMVIALLFGLRKKNQLLLLIGVNTATQILLNVLLNIINYHSGELAFVVFYVLLEIVVFVIEATMYSRILKKNSEKPKQKWFYWLYALIANAVSFCSGIIIAQVLPGIF